MSDTFLALVHDLAVSNAGHIAATATVCQGIVFAYEAQDQRTPDGDLFRDAMNDTARACASLLCAASALPDAAIAARKVHAQGH